MAVDEEKVEGSVSSLLLDSWESNRSADTLSPEDIAWVDSCLVKDPDISDGDWSSLKDVLLEVLSLQLESPGSSVPKTDGFPGGRDIELSEASTVQSLYEPERGGFPVQTDAEMISSSEAGTLSRADGFLRGADTKIVPSIETDNNFAPINAVTGAQHDEEASILSSQLFEAEEISLKDALLPKPKDGDQRMSEPADSGPDMSLLGELSEASLRDAFLPNFKDDNPNVNGPVDTGIDLGFSVYDMEPSTEDIFKVWDLGIPAEEDELIKQLNKALSESPIQSMASIIDDSGIWKDLKEHSLDNLISGIADLSLDQHSS